MEKSNGVIIYTTPACAYCYTIKSYLKEKGIDYREIDIDQDEQARKKMEEISGQRNVPVTVINGKVVIGWQKNKINELLNI